MRASVPAICLLPHNAISFSTGPSDRPVSVSNDIMATFPLVLIPGFAVPMYVITHLIIYAQLKRLQH